MSASWLSNKQSVIYTTVKVRAERALQTAYPNIRFTADDSAQLKPQFPTVYIHYLQGRELARDLEDANINAFSCDAQVDVTVSKAQGKTVAEQVANTVIDEFKKLQFGLRGTPTFVPTGTETKQLSFRVNRTIGSDE